MTKHFSWRTAVAASATAVVATGAMVLADSGAALASTQAASNCEPLTSVYADGSTIHFNGYTLCNNPLSFYMEIGYMRIGGQTIYSPAKTCNIPEAQSYSCGVSGIYATLTDSMAGSQQWCMSTFIHTDNPSPHGVWSLKRCINH